MISCFRYFPTSAVLVVLGASVVVCSGDQQSAEAQTPTHKAAQSIGDKQTLPAEGSWQIAGAKVQSEDVMDSLLKTQITLRVSIPRGTTRDQLDEYLRGIYAQQVARTGFSERKHPNSVCVYVHPEGVPHTGLAYVGSVMKAASDEAPTFMNSLVDRGVAGAREALGASANPGPVDVAVEETADGLRVTLPLTERYFKDEYAAEIRPRDAWTTLFGAAELLYYRVPDADRVQIIVQHRTKVIIDARLTMKTFAALHYHEVMDNVSAEIREAWGQVGDGALSGEQAEARERRADLSGFRTLLKRLPPGAIDCDPSVEL